MSNYVVGVDLATQGAALCCDYDGKVVSTLLWDFKKQPEARTGLFGMKFREYVRSFSQPHKLVVVFEEPFSTRYGTATVLHELIGVLKFICEDEGCTYIGVNTARLRSQMGVKGNKRDVVKANIAAWAASKYPAREWKTQDEMDAALVANWFINATTNP